MYTAYLFGALIIVMGETGALGGTLSRKDEFEQRVLLRKLQYHRRDSVNNETVTWNEILADVLVKKLNVFSDENREEVEKPAGMATKLMSNILNIYKSIYDGYRSNDVEVNEATSTTEKNPKEDVEIVNTAVRIKDCVECDKVNLEKSVDKDLSECPDGYFRNNDGNCEDPVSSKIIMAIPSQCPFGYKPDRLGFCRLMFNF